MQAHERHRFFASCEYAPHKAVWYPCKDGFTVLNPGEPPGTWRTDLMPLRREPMKRLSAHQRRDLQRRQQRSQRPRQRARTRRVPRGEHVWESSVAGVVFTRKSEEPEDF